MKDLKPLQSPGAFVEPIAKDTPKTKKMLTLFLLGIVLVVFIVGGYILVGKDRRDSAIAQINQAITSIDTLLNNTDDIDEKLSDLSDDFLDSEAVSTNEIDDSLDELDSQLEELDGLDEEFELEASDVGLE